MKNECCKECDLKLSLRDCSDYEQLECQIKYIMNKYNDFHKQTDYRDFFYDFVIDNLDKESIREIAIDLVNNIE